MATSLMKMPAFSNALFNWGYGMKALLAPARKADMLELMSKLNL